MQDEAKMRRMKTIFSVVVIIIVFLLGYGIGGIGKQEGNNKKSTETASQTQKKEKVGDITQKVVKDFLVAYYTKKDLEENRERYRPFMTPTLYNQETKTEENAINQTYKGYVVDYVYQRSTIYIDNENKTAIVQVKYTNTLLTKKKNYDRAQSNVMNETTLKLTYVNRNGKLLVDKKEVIHLSSEAGTSSSYPDYASLSTEEETSPSSSETATSPRTE